MKTKYAIQRLGGKTRDLARHFGISTAAVYAWGDDLPPLRAYQLRDHFAKQEKANAAPKVK